MISQDSYYIDQSENFRGDGSVNFDHPQAIDFNLLAEHILELKKRELVNVPRYDFSTHERLSEHDLFRPKKIILVDGILILSQDPVRQALDLKVFIDAAEAVRFSRRLRRDIEERGRTHEGVKKQFEAHVKPMHDMFVEPSKFHADVVMSGEAAPEVLLSALLQKLKLNL